MDHVLTHGYEGTVHSLPLESGRKARTFLLGLQMTGALSLDMPLKWAAAMMDSKQIKPSKQSRMPSSCRQVSACFLSELVNTHLRPGNACARDVLPSIGDRPA